MSAARRAKKRNWPRPTTWERRVQKKFTANLQRLAEERIYVMTPIARWLTESDISSLGDLGCKVRHS